MNIANLNGAVATSIHSIPHASPWFQWAHGLFLFLGMLTVTIVLCWSMYRVVREVWNTLKWDVEEGMGNGEVRGSVRGGHGEVANAPVSECPHSFVPGVHESNPPMKCVACEIGEIMWHQSKAEHSLARTRELLSHLYISTVERNHHEH